MGMIGRVATGAAVLVIGVMVGGCGSEQSEEGIVLAKSGWSPPAGVTVEKSTERWLHNAKMVMSAGGRKLEGGMSTVSRGDFREEVVDRGVVRVTCVKDRQRNVMVVNGKQELRPEVVNPLEGQPVLVERRGPLWEARLESGKSPSPGEQRALHAMAAEWTKDTDVNIYGTAPRRIGDEWEVDAANLPSLAGAGEELSGTMTIRLSDLGEFGGYKCAVLEGDLDVTGQVPGAGGAAPRKFRIKGKIKVQRSLEHFVDLRYELKGLMFMSGIQKVGEVDMTLVAEGEMIMRGMAAIRGVPGVKSGG
jgi:hypothetical protein